MKTLRPIMMLSVLMALLLGTAQPAAAAAITFTSGAPASPVTAYEPYPGHTFVATGDAAINFSLASGSLPPGMALSSAGAFSGTPTTPGSYTFTVRATGTPSGDSAEQDVTVVVEAPVITITSDAPASPVTAYQPYPAHTFTASGGTGPYTLSLRSGALPPGMAVSSAGLLSGTPTTPGSYSFGIRMTDAHGFSADQDVTVVIADPAATITSGEPPRGAVGEAYSFRFTATGDSGIRFSVAAGELPGGLTLAADGLLSGTPETAGSFTLTIKATGTASSATDEVTLVIDAAPSSPSPTPTSPAPSAPSSASPSATAGPWLPVTGSDPTVMLLLGVAAIAAGGMLVVVAYERRRRSLTHG